MLFKNLIMFLVVIIGMENCISMESIEKEKKILTFTKESIIDDIRRIINDSVKNDFRNNHFQCSAGMIGAGDCPEDGLERPAWRNAHLWSLSDPINVKTMMNTEPYSFQLISFRKFPDDFNSINFNYCKNESKDEFKDLFAEFIKNFNKIENSGQPVCTPKACLKYCNNSMLFEFPSQSEKSMGLIVQAHTDEKLFTNKKKDFKNRSIPILNIYIGYLEDVLKKQKMIRLSLLPKNMCNFYFMAEDEKEPKLEGTPALKFENGEYVIFKNQDGIVRRCDLKRSAINHEDLEKLWNSKGNLQSRFLHYHDDIMIAILDGKIYAEPIYVYAEPIRTDDF